MENESVNTGSESVESTANEESSTGLEIGNAESQEGKSVEATEKAIARKLGAADMDALVPFNINGKIEEIPLREALKQAKIAKSSQEKWTKAKTDLDRYQKLEGDIKQLFNSDPSEFFRLRGMSPEDWAFQVLQQKVEREQMSPEAKRAWESEIARKSAEAERDALRQKFETDELTRQEQVYETQVKSEIGEALKRSGLPNYKWYQQMAANEMIGAIQRQEEMTWDSAFATVKEKIMGEHLPEILSKMPVEELIQLLGDDRRKSLREFEIKTLQHQGVKKDPKPTLGKKTEKKVFTKDDDYRKWVESLKTA